MRVQLEPAYVVHHRDYGETSLLLEVFSRHHGRIGLLAKGARRNRSPLHSALIPFQPLTVSFSGRGELPVLSQAEPSTAAPPLTGRALFCGLYLNELLLRLLHRHDPHERLFQSYAGTLEQLAASGQTEAVLRVFEKRLLEDTGYGLVLDHDVADGAPLQPDAQYRYLPERGPVPALGNQDVGISVHGASLLALAQERLETETALRETKTLLRALLARQLAGRPLMSRQLFRTPRAADAVE
jgi:DNA repair protein RecO (recombination protein O)